MSDNAQTHTSHTKIIAACQTHAKPGEWLYFCHRARGHEPYFLSRMSVDAIHFNAINDLVDLPNAEFQTFAMNNGLGSIDWTSVRIIAVTTTVYERSTTWDPATPITDVALPIAESMTADDIEDTIAQCQARAKMPEEISKNTLNRAAGVIERLQRERVRLTESTAALTEEVQAYRLAYSFSDDPDWMLRLAKGGKTELAQLTAYLGHPPQHLDLTPRKMWDFGQKTSLFSATPKA